MFDYKGIAKIGNRELIGDLVRRNGKYYIMPHNYVQSMYNIRDLLFVVLDDEYEVFPESLSVTYTGLTDKNGNQIYASSEIDGKMSRGGDILKFGAQLGSISDVKFITKNAGFLVRDKYGDWLWLYDVIASTDIEIIGKQWSENEN
jgi:hypothetical protein